MFPAQYLQLKMEIISIHVDNDRGALENALGLSPEDLAIRKVDVMDIGSEQVRGRAGEGCSEGGCACCSLGSIPALKTGPLSRRMP